MAAMLYSALSKGGNAQSVTVYAIDGGILPQHKQRIATIVSREGARLNWLCPDGYLEDLEVGGRYPTAAYHRLLIADLLPSSADKAIYLDCDLIVDADLSGLWDLDIGNYSLLASQDAAIPLVSSKLGLSNYRDLGRAIRSTSIRVSWWRI